MATAASTPGRSTCCHRIVREAGAKQMSLTIPIEGEHRRQDCTRAADLVPVIQSLAARYDRERTFPEESFRAIRAANLLTVPFETDDPDAWLKLLHTLKHVGRGDLSVGRIYEGHINAIQLIQMFGSSEQVDTARREAGEGQMLFAVWNTEAGDGVQLEPLPGGGVRMHGSKTFASGAGNIQRPIVTGRLPDGGWQMCVVPADQVNLAIDPSWWQPPGMHGSTSFKVDFTGVEIGPERLIGAPDDYHRQPWFSGGAVRFAAVQLGGAEALLDETRAFLQSLNRTSDALQRARAGDAAILVESGNLWLDGAARSVAIWPSWHRDEDAEVTINYANMTRLAVEKICTGVMELTAQSVGARGMLAPHPIERIMRDLMLYLRQPAPDAARAGVGELVLERTGPVHKVWHER